MSVRQDGPISSTGPHPSDSSVRIIGLVPAAGEGRRLSPLPFSKELLPVGFFEETTEYGARPKPVCMYLLERIRRAGQFQWRRHVFQSGRCRNEVEGLKHHTHMIATEPRQGVILHTLYIGREPLPADGPSLWDCPHTLTLRMMFQSLERLLDEHDFSLLHSFFLYPVV